MTDGQDFILLDACTVINLYASRMMSEIVATAVDQFGVVQTVYQESLYVVRGGTGEDADESELIDLSPMIQDGSLLVVPEAAGEELETFVDLATELDDGEAMTLALALHRGYKVATDDRKAIRIAATQVSVVSSLELVRDWADRNAIPPETIRSALIDIRDRGSYVPSRTHQLRSWWEQMLSTSQRSNSAG